MNELKKQGSDIVIQLSTSETSSAVGSGGYDGGNPPDDQWGDGDSGGDGDGSGDGFDPDDTDDDLFQSFANKFIEVAVMYDFNNVVTLYFMANPSWKMKALDYLICAKLKIPGGILEFSNSKGDDLYKMRTFDDNGIKRTVHTPQDWWVEGWNEQTFKTSKLGESDECLF